MTLRWAKRLDDPGISTIAHWWFGRAGAQASSGPPPLPAFSARSAPLAVLRADWARDGDLIAVDHRDLSPENRVEVMIGGVPVLGPIWACAGQTERARPASWTTGPYADAFEWTFRDGEARVRRTAVLFRGRKLALLAEMRVGGGTDGPDSAEIGLAPGVSGRAIEGSPGLLLRHERRKVSASVLPITLPPAFEGAGGAGLALGDNRIRLIQPASGRRRWLAMLLSWCPKRGRRPARWRHLTVTEAGRRCAPEAAFATHVTWGPGESYVIYRSLARPASRAFLGHQTSARFLIGTFSPTGEVVPLLSVEG